MEDSKISLSLCMIVKNEEKFIEGCLESVKDIVDEIVIIDTGCSDKTIEIATKYGAKIHTFEWCDDFSKARNESIKYATGDWILWLDADERLNPGAPEIFNKELTNPDRPTIYEVQINNATNDAASAYISTAYRLFSNKKGIKFTGRIHEQLAYDSAFGVAEQKKSELVVEHLGYAVEGPLKDKKTGRNFKLLKRMVAENPKSAYAHYTLGQQYSLIDEADNALKHFEKAYNLNQFEKPMIASLLNVMAEIYLKKGLYSKAVYNAKKSISIISDQVSAYYIVYRVADKEKRYDEGIKAVEKMLFNGKKLQKEGWKISTDVVIDDIKLLYTKAILLEKKNACREAFNAYVIILNKDPKNEEVLNRSVKIALKQSMYKEAEALLNRITNLYPNRLDAFETLGMLYIKQQNFVRAIELYNHLHNQNPNNENVTRRLAGLYLKIGKEKEAAELFS